MAEKAEQREARRRKIAMNADARLNRLLGRQSETAQSEEVKGETETDNTEEMPSLENENDLSEKNSSPYNLRQRGKMSATPSKSATDIVTKTSSTKSKAPTPNSIPYEVVEDPEVPDLGEFLANQKAAKAAEEKSRAKNNSLRSSKWTGVQYVEAIRLACCIITAFVSRYSLIYGSNFLSQSIFLPFIIFELIAAYVIHIHLQHLISVQPKGSLLTSALMLCGIKPDLIKTYSNIMNYITFITNDFFTYIFAFIIIHALAG